MVRPGELRHQIAFQTRGLTQDAIGQQATTWTNYMTGVWSKIEALTGRELLVAQSAQNEFTHKISVRYSALLADPKKVAGMRVVWVNGGVTRYFDITTSMNIDERNRQIDILAAEGLKYV